MRNVLIGILMLLSLATRAEIALIMEPINGVENQHLLSLIGQIRFVEDVMYLYDCNGSELGHTPLNEIGKVVFREYNGSATEEKTFDGNVLIYPNPTQEIIYVKGTLAGHTIRIYDLQGQLLLSSTTDVSNTMINVSHLQSGSYILQIGAELVKFIKQ